MATDLAAKLRSGMSSSEKQQVTKQGTQNPEAYELYTKGRYLWNKRTFADMTAAIDDFNQAIAKDPNYALAYAGLADAYSTLPSYGGVPSEVMPKSNAAARKALDLDPSLARPHIVLGSNEMEYDWDFAGGEAEYRKGLDLDPNDAQAHTWYGEDLSMLGRVDEGIAEVDRGHTRIYAHKYDDGVAICQKYAKENPTFAQVHLCLLLGYWAKGMFPEMIEEYKTYGQLSGDKNEQAVAAALAEGFHSGGWKTALARAIPVRLAQRRSGYTPAYALVILYAGLGDKDNAFQWLNVSYKDREIVMERLKTDPWLDELIKKVGLP